MRMHVGDLSIFLAPSLVQKKPNITSTLSFKSFCLILNKSFVFLSIGVTSSLLPYWSYYGTKVVDPTGYVDIKLINIRRLLCLGGSTAYSYMLQYQFTKDFGMIL
jgi:hypothetical protein